MITVADVLKETRRVIAAGWTQGVFARDADGYGAPVYTQEACSFCLVGAVLKAQKNLDAAEEVRVGAIGLIQRQAGVQYLHKFNDVPERTQEDVLGLLDKTIENL